MASNRTFQGPKGTRDFYPPEMAIRRHIENVWHSASIDSGFEEIEGPMFESLDLYTVKSGTEIVSQLFSFRREGGDDDYALRPEFTPTLARMAVVKGKSLALPTKWYSIPALFRAERPQRGRLREHNQWNVDLIGTSGASADIEVTQPSGVVEPSSTTQARTVPSSSSRVTSTRRRLKGCNSATTAEFGSHSAFTTSS